MKKCVTFLLLTGLFLYLASGELSAQKVKVERWVIGSGGMIDAKNSSNWKMSGIVGQLAIEKVRGTNSGKNLDLWQGFWVPLGVATDYEDPRVDNDNQLVNFPNPVSGNTTIRYNLPSTANVTLKVYNVSGNLVKVLIDGIQDSGNQEVAWDTKDANGMEVSSGSYMYELTVNPAQVAGGTFQSFTLRNIMIVVK